MSTLSKLDVANLIHSLRILVVDDSPYMRKIVRNLLTNVGVRTVYEAVDGIDGLDLVRTLTPDMVILDWEMPLLNGAEFVRIVRSPGAFPSPNIPIVMLTSHGERWRVIEAARLGVNEFLCKPVSARSLLDRVVAILANPRPFVQVGEFYRPEPRKGTRASEAGLGGAVAPTGTAVN